MKKKKNKIKKNINKALTGGFLLLTIITLGTTILFSKQLNSPPKNSTIQEKSKEEKRNGQQVASITIKNPESVQDTESEKEVEEKASEEKNEKPQITPTVTPGSDKVKFKISNFKKLAVQPLKFEIFNKNNQALTPDYLKSLRGEKIHFYLVHNNLKEFVHLIPQYKNGAWNISANMPTPGTYHAYIALHPLKEEFFIYHVPLTVRTPSPANSIKPEVTKDLSFKIKNLKASLSVDHKKEGTTLSYTITQGGKNVTLIPFQESIGQLMLISQAKPDALLLKEAANSQSDEKTGKAIFLLNSLSPGRYTAFAEFKVDKQIYSFPITFEI